MTAQPALHIISGKGGTGKSTLACSLAIGLAEHGQRVLLVETEARQSLAPLLGLERITYDEHRVSGAWPGELWVQSIEPGLALVDYVKSFFPLPGAAAILQRTGANAFVTSLAPGLKDVLITGKFCEAARRRRGAGYAFDAVVVDAPPTGRVHRFLNVTPAVSLVSPPGNVRAHAQRIAEVIRDSATRVHLVVNDDAAAMQEAMEAAASLTALGIGVGSFIHNRHVPQWPNLPDVIEVEQILRSAGAEESAADIAQMLTHNAREVREDSAASEHHVQTIVNAGYTVVNVPEVVAATVADLPMRLARLLDLDVVAATP